MAVIEDFPSGARFAIPGPTQPQQDLWDRRTAERTGKERAGRGGSEEEVCRTSRGRRRRDNWGNRLSTDIDGGAGARRDHIVVRIVQPAGPGRYADAAGTNPHRGLRVVLGVSTGRV